MWNFFQSYKIFFGVILIVIGLFEVLLGAKIMIVTIFIVTSLVTITVVFIFLFQFIIPSGGHPGIVWAALGISTVVGFILSYVVAKYREFFIGTILGVYMGYFVGIFLYRVINAFVKGGGAVIFLFLIEFCFRVFIGCVFSHV